MNENQPSEAITPSPSFTVWILADDCEDRKPLRFDRIVDVLKLPTGEVRIADVDGHIEGRYGEVIRMRQTGT